MMQDGELLERAARAAGLPWGQWVIDGNDSWNPLTDDGDALRLAVTLGITMYPAEGEHDGATTTWAHPDSEWTVVPRTADAAADLRRAIVLAAAALGGAR